MDAQCFAEITQEQLHDRSRNVMTLLEARSWTTSAISFMICGTLNTTFSPRSDLDLVSGSPVKMVSALRQSSVTEWPNLMEAPSLPPFSPLPPTPTPNPNPHPTPPTVSDSFAGPFVQSGVHSANASLPSGYRLQCLEVRVSCPRSSRFAVVFVHTKSLQRKQMILSERSVQNCNQHFCKAQH